MSSKARTPSSGHRVLPSLDSPINVPTFIHDVRRRNLALLVLVPVAILARIGGLILQESYRSEGPERRWWMQHALWDSISLGILFLFLLPFLFSLQRITLQSPKCQFHRALCQYGTFGLFLSTLTPALPFLLYVFIHKRSPPVVTIPSDQTIALRRVKLIIPYIAWLASFLAFLTIGTTRRGPQLACQVHVFRPGFGVTAEDFDIAPSDIEDDIPQPLAKPRRSDSLKSPEARMGRSRIIEDEESIDENAPLLGRRNENGRDHGSTKEEVKQNVRMNIWDLENSSCLGFTFGAFVTPFAKASVSNQQVSYSDVPNMPDEYRTENRTLPDGLEVSPAEGEMDRWYGRLTKDGDVTAMRIFAVCWKPLVSVLLSCLIWETLRSLATFIPPLLLFQIINALKNPVIDDAGVVDRTYPYVLSLSYVVYQITNEVVYAYNTTRETHRLHIPIKQMLTCLLYTKVLRASSTPIDGASQQPHNAPSPLDEAINLFRALPFIPKRKVDKVKNTKAFVPQITTLLSIDINTIASLATYVWNVIYSAAYVSIGVSFLWSFFGRSMFVALGIFFISFLLNTWIGYYIFLCDRALASARDTRISAMKELLLSCKVIKLNAWEPYHVARITEFRRKELNLQRRRYWLGTFWNMLSESTPMIALAATFAHFVAIDGHVLDPAAAFASFGIMGPLRESLNRLPEVFTAMLESKIAFDRLAAFFNVSEVAPVSLTGQDEDIRLQNATAAWPTSDEGSPSDSVFRLKDLDLNIPRGKFTLVYGALGSGKSLLLSTILGEADIISGKISTPLSHPGAIPAPNDVTDKSIFDVDTWLTNSIAYASQISYIRHGSIKDNILFGQADWPERYSEVLSAVRLLPDLDAMPDGDETEVGEFGINLSGGQRARICLARAVYSRANTVLLDDILSAVDSLTARHIYDQCLKGDILRGRTLIIVSHKLDLLVQGADMVVHLEGGQIVKTGSPSEFPEVAEGSVPEDDLQLPDTKESWQSSDATRPPIPNAPTRFYTKEERASGVVGTESYAFLFGAVGQFWYWLLFLILYMSTEGLAVFQTYWIRRWTSKTDNDTSFYLRWYAIILVFSYSISSFRWIWLYGLGQLGFINHAAKVIHADVLNKIANAPMRYLQSTPIGRLLNRCSADLLRIDSNVSDDVGRTTSAVFSLVAMTIVISISTPAFPLLLVIILVVVWQMAGAIRRIRADIKRLASVARSPLITLFGDTASSIHIYRSFGAQRSNMHTLSQFVDLNCKALFLEAVFWNYFKAALVSVTSILVAASWAAIIWEGVGPAAAGFIMVLATEVRDTVQTGLFKLMDLEQSIVCVERVAELSTIKQEVSVVGKEVYVPNSWPSSGQIEFRDFSAKYADGSPPVLKGINLRIKAGERVGIVGATGAGKSTLALSILRAVDRSSGSIEIDGIDIDNVPLHVLRHQLCTLPQEPLLCSGTLREALDITGLNSDSQILEALRRAHLDVSEGSPFCNLDTKVAIGEHGIVSGSNFSLGERQLLCLARALLKGSKILIMDEATSSVDYETDAKINMTIRESFVGTTLIVIVHRLQNLLNFDRIVVVDDGQIIEADSPFNLYHDSSSRFHAMVKADGTQVFEQLVDTVS